MDKLKLTPQNQLKRINNALFKLQGKKLDDLLWVLKHHKQIAEWIETTYSNINTKKSMYTALTVVFRDVHPAPALRKKYSDIATALNKDSERDEEKQELDPREQKNWKSYDELVALRDSFKNANDWLTHRRYILLSCYTMTPPIRSEYKDMRIVSNDKAASSRTQNYFVLPKNPKADAWIIINKDKVSTSHGAEKIRVNDELRDVMRASLKAYPRDYVLGTKPMPVSTFNQLLDSTGVKIDYMRSAYITQFYPGKSIADQKVLATKMRHSYDTAVRSYFKVKMAPSKENDKATPEHTTAAEAKAEGSGAPAPAPAPKWNRKTYAREYRQKHQEQIKSYMQQYRKNNSQNLLRTKLLWELNTGNINAPKPETIEKYNIKKNETTGRWE